MIARDDTAYERELIRLGRDEALRQCCDLMHNATAALAASMFTIQPGYKWEPSIADVHLSKLGKAAAASILDNITDDMPVDFRRIVRELLADDEKAECNINVARVVVEIMSQVKAKLKECTICPSK